MRSRIFKVVMVVAIAVAATGWTLARPAAAPPPEVGPALVSIGVMTFGPSGVLFAADAQAATIYALELGDQSAGGKAGAADVAAIDQKIASLLGTEVTAVAVKDLVIHPSTKNAYLAVMRGTGADAKPALLRVDGDGKITVVALDRVKYSKVTLPNPPAPEGARNQRADSITDMAFVDGKLIVAGLSNEEFASKLRSVPYPFTAAEPGTSVEIFHGNHGRLETRSPVYTFIPYTINNKRHVIASYTCTPLVRFPLESLTGSKVVGTTIAELGNRNRPLDMILLHEGRPRVPAHVEQLAGRHEDPHRGVRHRAGHHRAGEDRNRRCVVRDRRFDDGHRADGSARRAALDRAGADRRRAEPVRRPASLERARDLPIADWRSLATRQSAGGHFMTGHRSMPWT